MTTDNTIEMPSRVIRDIKATTIEVRGKGDAKEIEFSASSEFVVRRAWGDERLDHSEGAVRLGRMNGGAAPLLFNHNDADPIGIVKGARLEGGRLLVTARPFDTPRAREVMQMVEGGLRNVSIGYEIHQVRETRDGELVVSDWEPHESSIVSIPADPTIGLGRSSETEVKQVRVVRAASNSAAIANHKGADMAQEHNTASEAAEKPRIEITEQDGKRSASPLDIAEMERVRTKAINDLAQSNRVSEEVRTHWIKSGVGFDKIAEDILEIHRHRGEQADAPAMIGMSKKEIRQYSLMAAIRASQSNNWAKAGLELEAHRSLMERDNLQQRDNNSFFVPMDVQARTPTYGTRVSRDFSVAGAGGLVGTDHLAGSFIDLLRNQSVVMRMGATRLTGLRGNVAIPKQTAGTTAYWLASETTAITESQPTIGQLTLSPKNVAALTEISHQMLQQGDPSAEQLVLNDLAQTVALAADLGALAGDGTGGAPTGVTATAGIGTGFDPGVAALDYSHVLGAQQDVVTANAMLGGMGYVCDPATTVKLMTRVKFASTASPIWDGNILEGDCGGFPGMTSNQMAADTALFGAWSTLIMAEWGVLELAVNPNQNFAAGITGLRAWYTMDVGVRYAAAFSYANGIT